jgi:large subunit ribosomal protein L15
MKDNLSLSQLPRLVARRNKRLGRGHGSGKVKTSGRGTKGQNARGRMPQGFEGGQLPLIKRLPLLRGKGKNASRKTVVVVLPVAKLASLSHNTEVTKESLVKEHLIPEGTKRVKIVGGGSLSGALTVKVPVSKSAAAAIEKAGGKVE